MFFKISFLLFRFPQYLLLRPSPQSSLLFYFIFFCPMQQFLSGQVARKFSVTRLCFRFWPFTTTKLCPIAYIILQKWDQNFAPNYISPPIIAKFIKNLPKWNFAKSDHTACYSSHTFFVFGLATDFDNNQTQSTAKHKNTNHHFNVNLKRANPSLFNAFKKYTDLACQEWRCCTFSKMVFSYTRVTECNLRIQTFSESKGAFTQSVLRGVIRRRLGYLMNKKYFFY